MPQRKDRGDDSGDVIERVVRIEARPETVFRFFTEPAEMIRWLGIEAELDPRPGGVFRIDANGVDIIRGEFVEVVENRKLVFTWGWEGGGGRVAPGSTRVEVTFEPDGDATIVRVRHFGLRGEDRKAHAEGWQHYTRRLQIVGGGGDPGPDPRAAPDVRHG